MHLYVCVYIYTHRYIYQITDIVVAVCCSVLQCVALYCHTKGVAPHDTTTRISLGLWMW